MGRKSCTYVAILEPCPVEEECSCCEDDVAHNSVNQCEETPEAPPSGTENYYRFSFFKVLCDRLFQNTSLKHISK